jgi:hypothetical protein
MQPVVNKYNASDDASSFSHEYFIGIRKTSPRTLIVFLNNAWLQVRNAVPVLAAFSGTKTEKKKTGLRPAGTPKEGYP